jgi:16S rRNA processing protein RimM
MDTAPTETQRLVIGRINGLYGVRGWVKVYSYTDPITNILDYSPWQLWQHGAWHSVKLQQGQAHGKGIIAQLEGCFDRDQAARLLGAEIAILREHLPPPPPDEYYWSDLIGLTVVNQAEQTLGVVERLLETGAHDVLVVQGERERLIPFVLERIVLAVDLTARRIQVDWDADF